MQKLFGSDVWIKTRIANDEKWHDNDSCNWKIFSDVKTKEEIKYIKDNNGVVIRCQRPTKKKNNNY
jgi:hypothetical protein